MSVCEQGTMHSIEQAISALTATLSIKKTKQRQALPNAHNSVLAESVYAQVDVPQWDNSAMDGCSARQ